MRVVKIELEIEIDIETERGNEIEKEIEREMQKGLECACGPAHGRHLLSNVLQMRCQGMQR
jgi:hypothetical protein